MNFSWLCIALNVLSLLSNSLTETYSKFDRGPKFQMYNLKRNFIQFRPSGIQTEELQPCQSNKWLSVKPAIRKCKGLITNLLIVWKISFEKAVQLAHQGFNWCFSFAPELVSYWALRDLHRRAAYSICESTFFLFILELIMIYLFVHDDSVTS